MRLTILIGLLPLFGLCAADEPMTPADKFQALIKAQQKAQRDFSEAYRAAKTDEEREEASDKFGEAARPDSHAKAFLDLMKEHPKDQVALDALGWLLGYAAYTPEADGAVDAAIRDWVDDARLAKLIERIHHSSPATDRLLRATAEKNTSREVRG